MIEALGDVGGALETRRGRGFVAGNIVACVLRDILGMIVDLRARLSAAVGAMTCIRFGAARRVVLADISLARIA